jgi:hypothetical protein
MVIPAQIRVARGLLNWKQADLATAAAVPLATVASFEDETTPSAADTLAKIEAALAGHGIQFLGGTDEGGLGVWLRRDAADS